MGMPLYVYVAVGAIAAAMPLLWWSVAGTRGAREVIRDRLAADGAAGVAPDVREVQLTQSARERLAAPLIAALAQTSRRFTPVGHIEGLERRIALAGLTGRWPVERVLALKLVLCTAGFLAGLLFIARNPTPAGGMIALIMTAAGYALPDALLSSRARGRQDLIVRKLPDALDQITISVEAGLAFEAAMAEAGRSGTGPLADELIRTLQDIQIGVARTVALNNLVARTDVPDLRHFVIAVRQAEQYGVPIAQVLRVQAKEMRERRRQRAEERGMKMPVKILVPTIFFILPALFIVILGPAVIRLTDSLGG